MQGEADARDGDRPVGTRPAVSVIVPFHGAEAEALAAATAMRRLRLAYDDELIVADNTELGVAGPPFADVARVVRASAERSSYHARNAGAAVASRPWLLFLDADCVPSPDLLDRYFDPAPGEGEAILAGRILDHADHDSLLARYARSRNFYSGATGLQGSDGGYAPTGNLLVRREAFEALGGFTEGIRSAGDVELCWRLQAAGWTLGRRHEARAEHRHREDLPSFLGMLARYGAGARWLNTRYPGSSPRWPLSSWELGRSGFDAVRHVAAGRKEEAAFRLIDALGLVAHNVGYRQRNDVAP
jgi:GT2 family glycosyltransferase